MDRCGFGSPCEKPGLSVWIGGLAAGEERDGLVFDVANPCGVEISIVGAEVARLRRVPLYRGCVQYTGEPGERVMVSGHVLARSRDGVGPGAITWEQIDPCAANVVAAAPRIKLAISSCGVPGEVIIDSDSQISMPAGELAIDALVPGPNAQGVEGWQVLGTVDVDSPQTFVITQLVIRACPPAQCWCPGGVLSEWFPTDVETPATRLLVRPRRARTLAVQATGFGPPYTASTIGLEWRESIGRGVAATTIAVNTQQTIDAWGAFPFLGIVPTSDGHAALRWGIV